MLKHSFVVIMINDNILLVYVEAHMTRTSKKDEFITRRKQYFVLEYDKKNLH